MGSQVRVLLRPPTRKSLEKSRLFLFALSPLRGCIFPCRQGAILDVNELNNQPVHASRCERVPGVGVNSLPVSMWTVCWIDTLPIRLRHKKAGPTPCKKSPIRMTPDRGTVSVKSWIWFAPCIRCWHLSVRSAGKRLRDYIAFQIVPSEQRLDYFSWYGKSDRYSCSLVWDRIKVNCRIMQHCSMLNNW